ncbi:MAG TPA: DinB family protein [Abditibacteriaceae bacterium]|jgi:uncharacterized damage-inducible protein DinB
MPEYARTMSRYNRWMNEKLYAVCADLSDEARKQDRTAPFSSIHGTLNHLLLTDRMWLHRFEGTRFPIVITSLAHELYSDFAELRRERAVTDQQIDDWASTLDAGDFEKQLTFTLTSSPQERTMPLAVCIVHLFNHQTHHRGQLTTLLEQCGCDFGITDLPMMPAQA